MPSRAVGRYEQQCNRNFYKNHKSQSRRSKDYRYMIIGGNLTVGMVAQISAVTKFTPQNMQR
jgi:hypothetical protein